MRRTLLLPFVSLSCLALLSCPARADAADPLFDQSRLHEVRLILAPEDWKTLQDNYLTDDYYVANISLDGTVLRGVGLRSRGSGSRNAEKPGLKVDLNRYVSQDYNGYKTLVLRNGVQDPSFLRNRLAFGVFEAMGIAAPQNAFARLYVNEAYWGLYEIVEPVTKPFLKARLGEDKGNLFEYQWTEPYYLTFRGDDPKAYVPVPFEPKTNEDDLDDSGLVDFIRAIDHAPDETFLAEMGTWIDVFRLLDYVAVENVIGETDGLVGVQGMNNLYLYQYAGQRRFTFIPWDKDTTLHAASWSITSGLGQNRLTSRLLGEPTLQERYLKAVARVATEFVNARWLLPRLESAYTQIREAALLDTHKPFSNDEFELGVSGLRGVVAEREKDVLSQVQAVQALRR